MALILFLCFYFIQVSADTVSSSSCDYDMRRAQPAVLACNLTVNLEPLIITWQKEGQMPVNVATISESTGATIQRKWQNKVNIFRPSSQTTKLEFVSPTLEDAGCYICIFNCFGNKKITGKACLNFYYPPATSVNASTKNSYTTLYCETSSYPSSKLTWKIDPEMSSPYEGHKQISNQGIITQTMWSHIPNNRLTNRTVDCKITWKNNDYYVPVLKYNDKVTYEQTNQSSSPFGIVITIICLLSLCLLCAYTCYKNKLYLKVNNKMFDLYICL